MRKKHNLAGLKIPKFILKPGKIIFILNHDQWKFIVILVISITYLIGMIFFITLLVLKSYYCILAIIFPVFGYMWLITFGAKYVNNHFGLKETSSGTIVFMRKRRNFSAFPIIHVFIFLVTAIFRLKYEINKLILLKKELSRVR